ncbi:DegT/DnrJ/EryC1/StrS family aminotransferase [Alphaproteobacteria bacterium]|nr:DegT/DnrJ/EryC1/StrS family aminotransferase [Alphaproteobacteria bacterium]
MNVPFNDLYAQYLSLKPEIDDAIARTIQNSAFVRGPEVELFEESFARLIGVDHCVSCANGTDALYIAMHALGLKPGDEVIVPAHSWISTSETVTQSGGKVVFCDTRDADFTIDTDAIEAKITDKTVGIIPVHLYGHPAQMDAVMRIAKKHNLWVIEDCAQAHLATFQGKKVGQFGDAATFSFYPGKNLGAMGDAGALVTGDAQLARRAARFARHGGLVKGSHEIEGINSRLDGLQAAILNVKLPHLAVWTQKRQEIADVYLSHLASVGDLILPQIDAHASHVWHLFVIRTKHREALKAHLADNNIATVINYPVALPFLDAYVHQNNTVEDFPVAHGHQSDILSLPVFPDMATEQIEYTTAKLKAFAYG